ncbi:hypothetical protein LXL04_029712 [Taraxacum kok-saghyz]
MSNSHKILVAFNEFDKPIGDEGNELTQYLGTLVRMPNHVGVDYDDWRKVPIQKKEDMYTMVKAKFVIHPEETPEIKSWIFYSMGIKWRTWKASLKARFYDEICFVIFSSMGINLLFVFYLLFFVYKYILIFCFVFRTGGG